MASLDKDIAGYEKWLRKRCDVVDADLDAKHVRMKKSPFDFLRATYFRWARTIEHACPAIADAPRVACVGDIHVENFGTWRDADSRLVWGVNDFDEAAVMPYVYDLLRLATSARLAPGLRLGRREIASAVLKGYRDGLTHPRPILLDGHAHWLAQFAAGGVGASRSFWKEVEGYPQAEPPADVIRALKKSLPKGAKVERFASRRKGGGSLGRPRFLVIAEWNSGRVLREAKAAVPSAWAWARSEKGAASQYMALADGGYRSPDPALHIEAGYVIRRIAPDSRKIEIAEIQRHGLGAALLSAMGGELGSIHAADKRAAAILPDLRSRDRRWLHDALDAAERLTRSDFESLASARES